MTAYQNMFVSFQKSNLSLNIWNKWCFFVCIAFTLLLCANVHAATKFAVEGIGNSYVLLSWRHTKSSSKSIKKVCLQRKTIGKFKSIYCSTKKLSSVQLLDVVPTQGEVNYKLVITTKNKTVRLTRKVFITSEDSQTSNNVENNLGNVDPGEVTFDSACPAGLADQLIAQINQVRIRHGLSALSYSSRLALAADWHARANAAVNVLSHDGWFQRINDSGFLYSSISQNIASAYTGTTIEVLVDLWMNSQGHKANILDPGMTVTGVSCATADNGIVYWAQNFGKPRS